MSTSIGDTATWQCPHCKKKIPGVAQGFQFSVCPFCQHSMTVEETKPKETCNMCKRDPCNCASMDTDETYYDAATDTHNGKRPDDHPAKPQSNTGTPLTGDDPLTKSKLEVPKQQSNIPKLCSDSVLDHTSSSFTSGDQLEKGGNSSQGSGSANIHPLDQGSGSTHPSYQGSASANTPSHQGSGTGGQAERYIQYTGLLMDKRHWDQSVCPL